MVWSKQEFERELRRQLIELASLRKRVPPAKELLERIDRLEASHHYLLRKLSEYFEHAKEGKTALQGQGPQGQGPGLTAAAELAEEASPVEHFATNPSAPQPMPFAFEVTAGNLVLAMEKLQSTMPDVKEQCAACGKLLISAILAGGEVVYQEPAWYHAGCAKGGEGFGKQGTLN